MKIGRSELLLILLVSLFIGGSFAQDKNEAGERVIYKYKQYEKFDFDELSVKGEGGSPGDLSVSPRYSRKFENRLPTK